jgi:hypothetical protein
MILKIDAYSIRYMTVDDKNNVGLASSVKTLRQIDSPDRDRGTVPAGRRSTSTFSPPIVAVTLVSELLPRIPVPKSSRKTIASGPTSTPIDEHPFASQWNAGTSVAVWVVHLSAINRYLHRRVRHQITRRFETLVTSNSRARPMSN